MSRSTLLMKTAVADSSAYYLEKGIQVMTWMRLRSSLVFRLLGLLGVIAVGGCGGGPDVTLFPVTGSIKFDSKPVADALVTFSPQSGGRPATGTTNSEGKFRLGTFSNNDGAMAGDYIVTVAVGMQAQSGDAPAEIADENAYAVPEEADGSSSGSVPVRYASTRSSDLKAAVVDGGPTNFDFELTVE